ncbi:MAG: hypothetical protein U0Q15_10940 [Kineosporiaceae bacterium]
MSAERALVSVQGFFEAGGGRAGLILPDGWFGRPYDTLLDLTRAQADGGRLVVVLDDTQVLTFDGDVVAERGENGLRLSGFSALTWRWREYGSSVENEQTYASGAVEFVPPL